MDCAELFLLVLFLPIIFAVFSFANNCRLSSFCCCLILSFAYFFSSSPTPSSPFQGFARLSAGLKRGDEVLFSGFPLAFLRGFLLLFDLYNL